MKYERIGYGADNLLMLPAVATGDTSYVDDPTLAAGDVKLFSFGGESPIPTATNPTAERMDFTSGSEEPQPGDTIVGATSSATATVMYVITVGGAWGSGTASGFMFIRDVASGPFEGAGENINISGGTSNVLTADTGSVAGQCGSNLAGDIMIALTPTESKCDTMAITAIDAAGDEWEPNKIYARSEGDSTYAHYAQDSTAAQFKAYDGRTTHTFWVDKSGNDSNDGITAPKLTISAAISAMSSGDKLIVGGGTYSETVDASALDDIVIDAAGATITGAADVTVGSDNAVLAVGDRCTILPGLRVVNTQDVDSNYYALIAGDQAKITGVRITSACDGILAGDGSQIIAPIVDAAEYGISSSSATLPCLFRGAMIRLSGWTSCASSGIVCSAALVLDCHVYVSNDVDVDVDSDDVIGVQGTAQTVVDGCYVSATATYTSRAMACYQCGTILNSRLQSASGSGSVYDIYGGAAVGNTHYSTSKTQGTITLTRTNLRQWKDAVPADLADADKVQTSVQHKNASLDLTATEKASVNAQADTALTDYAPATSAQAVSLLEDTGQIQTNQATILGRIPATLFAGITSLAGWLRWMMRKDAALATDDPTSGTEINADGGSGAGGYGNTADSGEARADAIAAISVGAGSGPYTIPVTVKDGDGAVVQGAKVSYTNGIDIPRGTSNASGLVTLNCAAKTYTVAIHLDGYTFAGDTHVVTGDEAVEYTITLDAISPSAAPKCTCQIRVVDGSGAAIAGETVQFVMTTPPTGDADGEMYVGTLTATSNATGYVTIVLVRTAVYDIKHVDGSTVRKASYPVPDAGSDEITSMLGVP